MFPLILMALAAPAVAPITAFAAPADQAPEKTESHFSASATAGATILPGAVIDWSQSATGDIVLTDSKASTDIFSGVSRTLTESSSVGGGQEINYVEFH